MFINGMKINNILHRNAGLIRARTLGSCTYKGQMFVIASILVLIALIAVKNMLGIYATFEEKRFKETFTLDKQIRNLKDGFRDTVGIATMQGDANLSGIRFLYNFSNFTAKDTGAKLLYAFVYVNGTSQKFSVTVGNFLKDEINVTINATDSTPAAFSFLMNSSMNATNEFQSDISGMVNMTLSYSQSEGNSTERFSISTSAQRYAGAFFDIKIESNDEFVRSKEFYNRTW